MSRVYNFAAGPAQLPPEVIQKIQDELFDWRGTGVSILEIGHRTKIFQEMLLGIQDKLRRLMKIPSNYKILFMHAGAQGQFSAIPMNLVGKNKDVDYLITGTWSQRAADFAKNYANVNIAMQSDLLTIPDYREWDLNSKAAYLYYCPNETVNGLRFTEIPLTQVPLVADMTSCILSEEFDMSRFGLVYASAQKNLGIAGITVVIVRDDLLDQALPITPQILNYKLIAEANSLLNTVPTFALYVMDLMLDWLDLQGGVGQIALKNQENAAKLYSFIGNHPFYINNIDERYRSILNVPFNLVKNELLDLFLAEANKAGLKYLNGHVLVGGVRASMYNAMPVAGVNALINFMERFSLEHS